MPSAEHLKQFVSDKLAAAAEEIFAVFHSSIVEYEKELERHRRLFDAAWRPVVELRRTEIPEQLVLRAELIVGERPPLDQDMISTVGQEEADLQHVKEQKEKLNSRREVELKQEPEDQQFHSADGENNRSASPTLDRTVPMSSAPPTADRCLQTSGNEYKVQQPLGGSRVGSNQHVGKTRRASSRRVSSRLKTNQAARKMHDCRQCGESFLYRSLLIRHSAIHRGKRPHVCQECKKRYALKANLVQHMKCHRDVWPYVCLTCGKGYRSKVWLKTHQMLHAGDRQLCPAAVENQVGDPTVGRHPEESAEESEVRSPLSICAASGWSSELRQRSLSPAVSQSQAQGTGEHESGTDQAACHLTGRELPGPGTLSKPTGIGIETANKLRLSPECGEDVGVLGLKREPDETSGTSESPTADWNPEEPPPESEGKFPVIASVVSGASSDLPLYPGVSQSLELRGDLWGISKSTRHKWRDPNSGFHKSDRNVTFPKSNTFCEMPESESEVPKHTEGHVGTNQQVGETLELSSLGTVSQLNPTPPARKLHKCQECGKKFLYKSQLSVHNRTHTGERPFFCLTCGKRFSRKYYLGKHQKTHTGERPHACLTCGKGSQRESFLRHHERRHTGERPHTCLTCGEAIRPSSQLAAHERTHDGERPFVCLTCGKAFTRRPYLREHERTHRGERPYVCQTCGKGFTRKTSLRYHEKTHTGERPYVCFTCGKAFIRKDTLGNHQKLH